MKTKMQEAWQDPVKRANMLRRPTIEAKTEAKMMQIASGVIPCVKCKESKPLDEFPKHRTTRASTPRYAYCKKCHSEYQRANHFKRFFNISIEEYDRILEFQKGVCAVCLHPPKKTRLAVDHDHKTGLIRGLLCAWCNRAIGQFRDELERVKRVYDYYVNPPATQTLGEARYGLKGRVSNKKKTRDRLNKKRD